MVFVPGTRCDAHSGGTGNTARKLDMSAAGPVTRARKPSSVTSQAEAAPASRAGAAALVGEETGMAELGNQVTNVRQRLAVGDAVGARELPSH